MARLSGRQYKQLEEALLSAFTSVRAVERMVKHCLDEDLSEIVDSGNLSDVIFDLIKWTEAQGRIGELITEAHKHVPKNQELKSFYNSYKKQHGNSDQEGETETTDERDDKSKQTLKFKVPQNSSLENEKKWLKNFGFESSPFTGLYSTSAEHAGPSFLSNCFVDPDCLFDVLGQASIPSVAILYGEPGEGKTACRVMVDFLCMHGSVPDIGPSQQAYVLSVPHIDMSKISENPTLERHVVEILGRAMPQFVDLLMQEEVIKYSLSHVSVDLLAELNWYIGFYNQHLSIQQIESLARLGIKVPFDSGTYPSLENRTVISPVDHLKHWCNLMFDIGIKAIYVLVDGFDDTGKLNMDANREESYKIFAPLVRNRDLIDRVPHFALKCFVPTYIKEKIQADSLSNFKFLSFYPIKWTKEKMVELLQQRILFFRRDDYPAERAGFEDFCVTDLIGIEELLVDISSCNPRHLLKLCDLMVKAHCRAENKNVHYELTQDDFTAARNEYALWCKQVSSESVYYLLDSKDQAKEQKNLYLEHSNLVSESSERVIENEINVRAIIEGGENERVEFKSSLLWDISKKNKNESLLMVVGKVIAGMLNSFGGIILIGVNDSKKITGIGVDFQFLGKRDKNRSESVKKDVDGYGLMLIDLVKEKLGSHTLGAFSFSFIEIEDKTICKIEIQPSSQPVYFGKAEDFFVRRGTSTIRLTSREMVSYVGDHWRKS